MRSPEPVASAPRPAASSADSAAQAAGRRRWRVRQPQPEALADPAEGAEALPQPESFPAVAQLFAERREAILHAHLRNNVHLVRFEPGRIEVRPSEQRRPTSPTGSASSLTKWTGRRWVVTISREEGAPTLSQAAAREAERVRARRPPIPWCKAALETFPGAAIEAVRDLGPAEARSSGEGADGERDDIGVDGEDI